MREDPRDNVEAGRQRNMLTIWQQNIDKSLTAQHAVLNTVNKETDIICLQEPYFDFNKKLRAMQIWWLVYPKPHDEHNPTRTRAVMLVSRSITTDSWVRLDIGSTDVVGIRLETEGRTVCIFNIYVNSDHLQGLQALEFYLRSAEGRRTRRCSVVDIWVGDFNRHHPMWDSPCNSHLFTRQNLDAAEELIAMTTWHRVSMALRPHVATLQAKSMKNLTRPDNVFVTNSFQDHIIQCKVQYADHIPKADHFPIIMTCATTVMRNRVEAGRDFKKVDWKDFEEVLRRELANMAKGRIR